jgi:hypothetical protein
MADVRASRIWAELVEYFLKKELGISTYYSFFRYDVFPGHYFTVLYPYNNSRNMLSHTDIEKIRDFFVKNMGMREGGRGFRKEYVEMKKRGIKNGMLVLIFEYLSPTLYIPTFIIEIPVIYAEIGGNEYFFLSQVVIENKEDSDKMSEMLINKAEEALKGTGVLEELKEEWERYTPNS